MVPVNAVLAAVCEVLTVYVPMPPKVPAPKLRTTVPGVTPVPERVVPTKSRPEVTAVTVRFVPEMAPVTPAPEEAGAMPRPAGQKYPAVHGFTVPDTCPARQ